MLLGAKAQDGIRFFVRVGAVLKNQDGLFSTVQVGGMNFFEDSDAH